jgi:hypothetical protein
MGWNTSMIILNDAIGDISKDEEFGKKVHDAVLHSVIRGEDMNICNGARVIETHHADASVLIAVGGNSATVLTSVMDFRHSSEETQVKLLKAFAEELGYRVVKEEE